MHSEVPLINFLKELTATPSPSGYEQRVQRLYRERVRPWCRELKTDVLGSVFGVLGADEGITIMVSAHCDQIGFVVRYIDEEGFLYIDPIGGVDPLVATSQRVVILNSSVLVHGVMGRRAIHLQSEDERKRIPDIHDLHIDIGATCREDAIRRVGIGDCGVFSQPLIELENGRIASSGLDNKLGTLVLTEVVRMLHGIELTTRIVAVSTVQEEIGARGAQTSAFECKADVGIAIDVSHSSDSPGADKRREGDIQVGKGPVIYRGANVNPAVFVQMVEAATAEKIPFQIAAASGGTPTDANVMQTSGIGMATGLITIPMRYMHTCNEVVSVSDVKHAAELVASFCRRLRSNQDFYP